jgi:hypothetical protein
VVKARSLAVEDVRPRIAKYVGIEAADEMVTPVSKNPADYL